MVCKEIWYMPPPFVPSTTTKEETKEKSRINRKENEIGNNNNNKLQSISDQRKPEVEETWEDFFLHNFTYLSVSFLYTVTLSFSLPLSPSYSLIQSHIQCCLLRRLKERYQRYTQDSYRKIIIPPVQIILPPLSLRMHYLKYV